MKVKDFVKVLIDVKCSDKLMICDSLEKGEEVYYGYVNEKQIYKCLENRIVDGMWIGINEVCISIN